MAIAACRQECRHCRQECPRQETLPVPSLRVLRPKPSALDPRYELLWLSGPIRAPAAFAPGVGEVQDAIAANVFSALQAVVTSKWTQRQAWRGAQQGARQR